ncbi:Sigma intracellular receptor 2 [Hyphodiscus hymeniophilus]|uniref:Efficient mitochondria targeting-associated protein 19 n=1 Tax=Hyphodiscus hymeniophilus TaxID=353542 RepID=A0A9P6VK92_9HELO|nr:Sigma intracellular receptor 2 [Hyphodiscus hymeniophilus]
MATSISSRKRDLFYMVFFCLGIPSMFMVDLQALYPASIVPTFMVDLKAFYINRYQDQFFIQTPPFFEFFMWTEIFIQAPVMIWGVGALFKGSPKIPLVLLPYAVLIFVTTGACMYEICYWEVPLVQKFSLSTLYGPYLAISAFMTVDMFLRINNIINTASAISTVVKKRQ